MDLELSGKKALVLGSSTGIGKEVATSLINEGVSVAICARNIERLKKTATEIKASLFLECDLTKKDSGRKVVMQVLKEFGNIDILVTNAGGPPKGSFFDLKNEDWQLSFQSLFISTIDTINAAVPKMIENHWGRIIMITSIAAKEPLANLTTSNGLRAGLLGLAKSISNEIAKDGVTVNALLPGFTDTERLRELNLPEDKITAQIPAGRLGDPAVLAALATFLASNKASYITGQAIACDGGYLKGF